MTRLGMNRTQAFLQNSPLGFIPGGAQRREGDPAVRFMQDDKAQRLQIEVGALQDPHGRIPFPSAASRLQPGMTRLGDELHE
jgi:hypothetical protein